MQTGLSWPCLSTSLACGAFPELPRLRLFHHFFAFCHWRRMTMESESMKKTSMISMTQTTEQLIQRPSWPPKLDRRMTSWKSREHKVTVCNGHVSMVLLQQVGRPGLAEHSQVQWAHLCCCCLWLCFRRSLELSLLWATCRLPLHGAQGWTGRDVAPDKGWKGQDQPRGAYLRSASCPCGIAPLGR